MEIIQTGRQTGLGIPVIIIRYGDGGSETLPDGDWAVAAWKAGTITVGQFADEVMQAIDEDIGDGIMPADVATFSELHDHVDANMYLLDVAGTARSDHDDLELPNAIAAEVDRRLQARTTTGGTVPKPDYVYAVAYEGGITNGVYTRSKARAHVAWEAGTSSVRARSRVKRFEVREAPESGGQ